MNKLKEYKEFFEDRGVDYIRQFRTGMLTQPTVEDRARLNPVKHVWQVGDRYSKLAHRYYGNSALWWVIAWYNSVPTEADIKFGDILQIPINLSTVLEVLDMDS